MGASNEGVTLAKERATQFACLSTQFTLKLGEKKPNLIITTNTKMLFIGWLSGPLLQSQNDVFVSRVSHPTENTEAPKHHLPMLQDKMELIPF